MANYNEELVKVVKEALNKILDPDGTIEYYVDYRERGCLDSAEDIEKLAKYLKEANGDIKTAATWAFYDSHDAYEVTDYLEDYVREEVENAVSDYDDNNDTNLSEELEDIDNNVGFWDFLEYCGYNGVNVPCEEFYPSEICLDITLATYEEANHEGYIIDFFGGYYPHTSNIEDPEMRDNMLVEFMQSQGLEPEDVFDESKSGKVLDSVRAEINNMSSNIDFLTICASFDLSDAARLLSGDFSSITINPGTTMGIFDSWSGGGSIFEIEVASPWTVPSDKVDDVSLSTSSRGGYSVADVYGINSNDTGWYRNTVTVS